MGGMPRFQSFSNAVVAFVNYACIIKISFFDVLFSALKSIFQFRQCNSTDSPSTEFCRQHCIVGPRAVLFLEMEILAEGF